MKLIDPVETVLVVVGTTLAAEVKDRPLADQLRDLIDQRGAGHAYRRAVVLGDQWYLDHDVLHGNPTITVGGPGSNAVAQQFVAILPLVWSSDERAYLQVAFGGPARRATIWGMDASATMEALEAFVQRGLLDRFLDRAWRFDDAIVM